jgi:hypothetical protein
MQSESTFSEQQYTDPHSARTGKLIHTDLYSALAGKVAALCVPFGDLTSGI